MCYTKVLKKRGVADYKKSFYNRITVVFPNILLLKHRVAFFMVRGGDHVTRRPPFSHFLSNE